MLRTNVKCGNDLVQLVLFLPHFKDEMSPSSLMPLRGHFKARLPVLEFWLHWKNGMGPGHNVTMPFQIGLIILAGWLATGRRRVNDS
jgi:hypothetical protein